MKQRFKVYLAGPISGLTFDQGQDWRADARAMLEPHGIDGYSPLRQKHFLRDVGVLSGAYANPMATDRGIMTRDHFDCMTSDLILANMEDWRSPSVGTIMELAWAYAYRKPLVVFGKELEHHPMIREAVCYRLPTLDAALAVVQAILLPHAEGEV